MRLLAAAVEGDGVDAGLAGRGKERSGLVDADHPRHESLRIETGDHTHQVPLGPTDREARNHEKKPDRTVGHRGAGRYHR